MLPLYKKYWRTAFDIALIALTVYLILFISSQLYHIAAPVFLSFVVFLCIEPMARYLHKKGMRKPFASAISVLLFLVILLALFFGLGLIIVTQFARLADDLPNYMSITQQAFKELTAFLQGKIASLPPTITDRMNEYFETVTKLLSTWGTNALQRIIAFLGSFSTFMANFGIAIILAFFLSMEIDLWKVIARKKTPHTLKTAVSFFRNHVLKAIGSYIKAQAILVSITFVIVFVGLLILGAGNAFTIALVAAVFDILPLLGVPVIFIPWAVYLFIVGNTSLAIGLLILLAVAMLVRQLAEPKISGNSIGVSSAFLMLSFMIISLSIFGVAGLILSPILLILIKELWQQGYLQQWIRFPKEEFDEPPFLAKLQEGDAPPSEEASKSMT
ncbi:sporulation integral membrane protein YtvI [Paenibacillus sp. P96]|uniref:Sporulation integral membrane protein YtvI n=1 Tax=Paenibacillus zeirhizosphaerae TaxID=2987519 RepID=A0ABT9FKI0_9BACL|nr:sporulation integral membrane protein YtvI [Paenibacillus sp. P96]MDP4095234.1 sporulation integral membrane protein YtvI [Paenibacillus sp. P96]